MRRGPRGSSVNLPSRRSAYIAGWTGKLGLDWTFRKPLGFDPASLLPPPAVAAGPIFDKPRTTYTTGARIRLIKA